MLDVGHVPLPPYINWSNYFETNSSEAFPCLEDIRHIINRHIYYNLIEN